MNDILASNYREEDHSTNLCKLNVVFPADGNAVGEDLTVQSRLRSWTDSRCPSTESCCSSDSCTSNRESPPLAFASVFDTNCFLHFTDRSHYATHHTRQHPSFAEARDRPPTLAEVFKEEWDPTFSSYLEAMERKRSSSTGLLLPVDQLPRRTNNYSISNYTIEMVIAEGVKKGASKANAEIEKILKEIPFDRKDDYKKMLLSRAHALIRKKQAMPLCAFCRNNGEPTELYMSHITKDDTGRVVCPILRAYTCPQCGANGDKAHTIRYCPLRREQSSASLHMIDMLSRIKL